MFEQIARIRRHGLLINFTGNGKGKTTAALGNSLRALGWGWKVTVIQFCKRTTDTGENHFVSMVDLPLKIYTMGAGFSWNSTISMEEHGKFAEQAWAFAETMIFNTDTDLVVLDELNPLLSQGLLDKSIIIEALKRRPKWMHVIVTGRSAPPELIAASDLVSEVVEVKHPFDSGVCAQAGIEY